jgi:cytochrome P450
MTSSSIRDGFDPDSYDPCSESVKPNVEDYFAALRSGCPVHRHEFSEDQLKELNDNPFVSGKVNEMYSITRYSDIEECLQDPANFLNIEGSGPERMRPPPGGGTLTWSDGDAHKRSRRITQPALSPRAIAPLTPMLQKRIDDLIDGFAAQGQIDVMKDFALPLTSGMLTYLLGLPTEKASDLERWAFAILSIWGGDDEAAARGAEAIGEIGAFVAEVGPERVAAVERGEELTDALTMLLTTPDDNGSYFSQEEVVNAIAQLVAGGFESSATAITNGVYLFCTNPDERRKLEEQPELIKTGVEEVLRYMAPIEGLFRTTATPTTVAGVELEQGAKVRAVFASANMDEEVFTNPRQFKIDRERRELNKHMTFGRGVHTCLGNALARQELKLAFTTLFGRLPTLEIDPDKQPTRNKLMIIHGYDYLPVRWDPASVRPRAEVDPTTIEEH